jgi:hypothetical protein
MLLQRQAKRSITEIRNSSTRGKRGLGSFS